MTVTQNSMRHPLFGPVHQLGFVVENLDAAIDFYTPIFGTFADRQEHRFDNMIFRGRRIAGCMQLAFAHCGGLEIELIEVSEGYTIHSEFLKKHAPGLHHLCFKVPDFEQALQRAAVLGYQPVCGQHIEAVCDYQYLENPAERAAPCLEFLTLYNEQQED